jgi:hypothetical protein
MNRRCAVGLALVAVAVVAFLSHAQDPQAQPPPPPGMDVQARGPVHEAFAEPISDQPAQGAVVAKEPPAPIDELPPEEKPAGDNVQWIPGYWAFDEEAKDFLWVSGFWRDVPPGRRWVPGHWQEADQGWVWTSGFWGPDNLQQVQYLPPPPPTVENGPSVAAPDPTNFYVGGCWVYQGANYRWRPGHWVSYRPGWVWIPAHFVWTPVGCIFIDGYWDHPLELRGLLFAPVRFDLAVWRAARRPFIPAFVIHTDFLIGALFVGPHTRHYFFGDYFEDRYVKRGFVAWTDYRPRKGMFDPNFVYYRHLHAAEPGWENSLRELYTARRTGVIPRPPRTLVQQTQIVNNITVNKTVNTIVNKNINLTHVQNVTVLAPLKQVNNIKVTGLGGLTPGKESKVVPHTVQLQAVPKADYVREQKIATQVRDFAVQRRETEAKILGGGNIPVKHTDPARTVKLPLPAPPPHVTAPPPPLRVAPPLPVAPPHVEHVIPKYEPHPPLGPPKKPK